MQIEVERGAAVALGRAASDKSAENMARETADLALTTGAFQSQGGPSPRLALKDRRPSENAGTAVRQAEPGVPHQIIFIDSTVPDYQGLLAGLATGTRVYVFDPNQDGLQQMARILGHSRDVSAVSIISHGAEGEIKLGSTVLTPANLTQHQAALQAIGNALGPDGDLLIYGCDVGEDADGLSFVDAIAKATGVTVAAASHLVGDVAAGDGWNLDVQTGAIVAPAVLDVVALNAYAHPLVLNDPPTGLPINVSSFLGSNGFLISGNTTVTSGGVLQLTNATTNQDGMAVYSTAFPSTTGISVQFNYFAGGGNGADGISFFLINADAAGAASNIVEGASGGGLGYSDLNVQAGITSGFLGLGLDTHGNFSSPGNSITLNNPTGTGRLPNSIAVRGQGTGLTGYALLTNAAYTPGIDGIRTVKVNLVKVDSSHELLSVFMSNDGGTTFQEFITNFAVNQVLPNNFYLGFAASTGSAFDTHQINNVSVTLPVDLKVSAPLVNYPTPEEAAAHTLLPGDAFSYSYTITNNGPNGSSHITVQDTPPSNVIGVHWTLQDDLHPAGNLESGTGGINLSDVNLSNRDVATVTVFGTIDPNASSGNANHAITVTPGTGFSFLTPATGQVGLGVGSPAIFVIGNTATFPTTDTASVLPFGLIQITDSNAGALDSATIVVTGTGERRPMRTAC
jgi:uncharacterized repeat protein (TIGR01451 family)